jgi:hypothetical protein
MPSLILLRRDRKIQGMMAFVSDWAGTRSRWLTRRCDRLTASRAEAGTVGVRGSAVVAKHPASCLMPAPGRPQVMPSGLRSD